MGRVVQVAKFTSDSSEVRRDFDRIGDAGEKMGKRVKQGANEMGPALRALDAGAGVARQKVEGLAGSAGSAGTVLRAMGPIGLAAAAGIGAAAVAFTALNNGAREAVSTLGKINTEANRLGVSTQALQEWRFAVLGTGAAAEQADAAIAAFAEKLGEATLRRSGGGFDAMRMLGFSADEIGNLRSIEEALPRIADRLAGVASAAEQVRIARELGLEPLLPLLQQGAGAFDRAAESAHRLGYVMDEELLQRAAQMNGEWQQASEIIDLQFKAALVELAPIFLDIAKGIAEASVELRQFLDMFKEVERRGRESVNSELSRNGAVAQNLLDRYGMRITEGGDAARGRRITQSAIYGATGGDAAAVLGEREARDLYAYLVQRGDQLRGRLSELSTPNAPTLRTGGGGTTNINPTPTDPEIARLRAFVETLEDEAEAREQLARIQAEFPNATREEIAARSALTDQMEQLEEARRRGVIASDEELERLRGLAQASYDAAAGERELAAATARRAEVLRQVQQFSQSVETPREALARQERELRALRDSAAANGVAMSDEDFARGLERIQDQYRELAAAQYEASLAGQILQGVWDGQIRSLEDIEALLVRIASDAVLRELLAGGVTGEGGFGGFASRVLDRIGVSVTGDEESNWGNVIGGASEAAAEQVERLAAAGAQAAGEMAGALAPSVADAAAKVLTSTAATAAEVTATNTATASMVVLTKSAAAAAAALARIAAQEGGGEVVDAIASAFSKGGGKAGGGSAMLRTRHAFAEQGPELLLLGGKADVFPNEAVEGLRMLSRAAQRAAQPAAGAPGAIAINLRNEGEPLEAADASAQLGPDGTLDVSVLLRRGVAKEFADGNLDNVVGARFGVKRRRVKR